MPTVDEILNRQPQGTTVPPPIYPPSHVFAKKLLIVLSYWDGDRDMMATLVRLIADLQETPNTQADILLYRRNDAAMLDVEATQRISSKFAKVQHHKCRRLNAKGYPYGPNEMFYDLTEFLRGPQWTKEYYAFLNMEADCCPLSPDWISTLVKEWKALTAENGKHAIGHVYKYEPDRPDHLNGAALYAIDIFDKFGQMALIGGSGSIAYDFLHRIRFLEIAQDTPFMAMDFNRKTITAKDLFSFQKQGEFPVYLHGVKDLSAMKAVRSRFIDKGGESDLASKTIATYFEPTKGTDIAEEQACLDIWKEAWAAAGWNPVVLNRFDAAKHKDFGKNPSHPLMAFEAIGGGVFAACDVLPRHGFSPERLMREPAVAAPYFIVASRTELQEWADTTKAPDFPAFIKDVGKEGWGASNIVRFDKESVAVYSPGSPRSKVMLHFFRARM